MLALVSLTPYFGKCSVEMYLPLQSYTGNLTVADLAEEVEEEASRDFPKVPDGVLFNKGVISRIKEKPSAEIFRRGQFGFDIGR